MLCFIFIQTVLALRISYLGSFKTKGNTNVRLVDVRRFNTFNFYILQHYMDVNYLRDNYLPDNLEPNFRNLSLFNVSVSDLPYEFNVPEAATYYSYATTSSTRKLPEDGTFIVKNNWGWLPRADRIIQIFAFVQISFYIIITIMWAVNKLKHMLIKMHLNTLFIGCNLCILLISIAFAVLLTEANKDYTYFMYSLAFIILFVRVFIYLFFFIMMSTGLSLVDDKVSLGTLLLNLLASLCLPIAFILMLLLRPIAVYFALAFFIVSYLFYIVLTFFNGRKALQRLNAHIIMIDQAGINPASTPTFKKIQMLQTFTRLYTFGFILLMLACVWSMVDMDDTWQVIIYLPIEIGLFVIFAWCGWLARLRNSMQVTYNDNEDEDAYRVRDEEDPEESNEMNAKRREVLIQWQKDMKLPQIPTVAPSGKVSAE